MLNSNDPVEHLYYIRLRKFYCGHIGNAVNFTVMVFFRTSSQTIKTNLILTTTTVDLATPVSFLSGNFAALK
jgi:hypothetical protein